MLEMVIGSLLFGISMFVIISILVWERVEINEFNAMPEEWRKEHFSEYYCKLC